jgi:hypothetical protein
MLFRKLDECWFMKVYCVFAQAGRPLSTIKRNQEAYRATCKITHGSFNFVRHFHSHKAGDSKPHYVQDALLSFAIRNRGTHEQRRLF